MQGPIRSKYTSKRAVSPNLSIPLSGTDPRMHPAKKSVTKSNIGSDIEQIGLGLTGDQFTLSVMTSSGLINPTADFNTPQIIIPPIAGTQPVVYPGGSGPVIIIPTDPSSVTAVWGTYAAGAFTAGTGDDLQVSFTYDTSIDLNVTMSSFSIKLGTASHSVSSGLFTLDKTTTSQVAVITKAMNTQLFNIFTPVLTSICVQISDPLANISNTVCAATIPTYVLNLNAPTITVARANNGYILTVTNTTEMAKSAFDAIDVWELENTGAFVPTITYDSDGRTPLTYVINGVSTAWPGSFKRVSFNTINPVTVISPNLSQRYVMARFSSSGGIFTAFSTPLVAVVPISPISVDLVPPNDVTITSQVWSSGGSGNDIVINYTLPGKTASITNVSATGGVVTYTATNTFAAGEIVTITGVASSTNTLALPDTGYNLVAATILAATSSQFTITNAATGTYQSSSGIASVYNDSGVRFVAQLSPTGVTSPPTGYFYFFPDGTASLTQTATIKKADMFSQFGAYYSAFSGYFKSIDSSDNRSGGVSLSIPARTNPLSGITPGAPTAVGIANGITITWPTIAASSYTEVYQKYYSTWAASPSTVDYYTATVSAVDVTTPSAPKLTLTSIKDQDGVTQTSIATGYVVTSSASSTIANNSWLINFASNQITLNQALTSSTGLVGSTVTMRALVYRGSSPAIIQDTTYATSNIRIRYYDDWGNASNFSGETTALSISPVAVDVTPPAATGSVTATGGIDTSGVMGFNGYITISFTAVTDTQVRGYRIRYSSDSGTTYTYADYGIDQANPPTGTLTYKLTGLAIGATYQIAVGSYDQFNNVSSYTSVSTGTTITGTPAISNYITAGNFQFGYGIGGVGTQKGLYFDSSNYWYIDAANSARLKVGGVSSNYLQWDGTNFTVDGNITARGGSFTGNVLMNGGSIYSGTTVATTISGVVGTGSVATYTTVAAHGLSIGNVVNIVGLTNAGFNGTYTITGITSVTPFTFTAANNTNATITTQTGTIYNISTGYVLNPNGLRFNNVTTIDGVSGQLITSSAQIANWSITANKFENTLYGSAGSYTGLAANAAGVNGYSFWAGSTVAGGDATNFAVTPTGTIYAKDIRISGGSADIGSTSTIASNTNALINSTTLTVGSTTAITPVTTTAITAISGSAGIVTYSANPTTGLVAGQTIVISGATTANYNGTYTIGVVTANTNFTVVYAGNITAAVGAAGTVTYTCTNQLRAGQIVTITGLTTTTGSSLNLSTQTVVTATATQFTISNAAVGTATGTQTGKATPTGTTSTASGVALTNTITVASATGLVVGMPISGAGIATGATITNIAGTTITLSATNIAVPSGSGTFAPINLSNGMYAVGTGIKTGTTVVSGAGTTSLVLSLPTTSAITNGSITFVPATGAHILSSGSVIATDAVINGAINAKSGSFTGNVQLGASGSLYSGTISSGTLSGLGFILNQNGLLFQNAGGSAITQITASTGAFLTTSASIGNWTVNSNQITAAGLTGGGTITLDSANGNISVSNGSVGAYTAGINGTTSAAATSNVFWAGTGGATSPANAFRVTLDGSLYASSAVITGGSITTKGTSGTGTTGSTQIVIDGVNDLISMSPGSTYNTAYMVPRNGNFFITPANPFATALNYSDASFTGDGSTTGVYGNPFFAVGSVTGGGGFKDPYNVAVSGIGIYTGAWDYFGGGTSKPFITATTTGLQLSASNSVGILLEPSTNSYTTQNPGILLYTGIDATTKKPIGPSYTGTTTFGPNMYINPSTQSIGINATASIFQKFDSSGIYLYSGSSVSQSYIGLTPNTITMLASQGAATGDRSSAYTSGSKIVFNAANNGLRIYGLPIQGDADIRRWVSGATVTPLAGEYYLNTMNVLSLGDGVTTTGVTGALGSYRNASPLGPYARQRMLVEDPVTGMTQLGMAVYYSQSAETPTGPSFGGYIGDLWVVY